MCKKKSAVHCKPGVAGAKNLHTCDTVQDSNAKLFRSPHISHKALKEMIAKASQKKSASPNVEPEKGR
jgi:hypothetical protein